MSLNILGISAFYHDAAAAIVRQGEIVAAAQEERFTRKKHDASFPANAVRYCLEETGLSVNQLDAVVFYDKPLLKFERLLETYYGFSPKGIKSFVTAIPVWLKEKLFLKKLIKDELKKIEDFDKSKINLLFPEHHLSHAASAFFPSPFSKAAILTVDGVGEWATASLCHGQGNRIKILKELRFPHSPGLLYSAFTYYLGFRVNSGEYKLMGLAPYGNPRSENYDRYVNVIKEKLVTVNDDGSLWLNQNYFSYATGLRMVNARKWEKLFGFPRRKPESGLEQRHCDLALAIQKVTEETVLNMAKEAKRLTGAKNLCLAGGVALNCVANGKIIKEKIFDEVWIQPAAGDAGGSLGAALAANFIYYNQDRETVPHRDSMNGAYLGPEFSGKAIELTAKKHGADYSRYGNFDELTKDVAGFIADGYVVGWYQGKMEFGPRALGNRSIIGDARNSAMQKKLNLKIKFRESFRPFAPAVLAEQCKDYFELEGSSPYMLVVGDVAGTIRKKLPGNYYQLPVKEKLYIERSDAPAITHVDFSARIQTVHRETNPKFWNLIDKFRQITNFGLVVNTSFNVRGEPIVCTPDDAYKCFMRTNMDYLVMGNFVFDKKKQPEWDKQDDWKEEFKLD